MKAEPESRVARASVARGWWATWAKALRLWIATPQLIWSRDPVRYYEYLGDDVVEGENDHFRDPNRPLWLNLGCWRSARTHAEAAAALACLLAETAELRPYDALLDVGFGFAEQDFLWLERYGLKHITGLNISPMQVAHARERANERGAAGRLALHEGSATDMPFQAGTFDKVTALECAHHFEPRDRFFAEAFRVLRPGGRLAIADGLPLKGHEAPGLGTRMVLKRWAYPVQNFYARDVYERKLAEAGFVDVRGRSIREDVFPGFTKYADLRRRGIPMESAVVRLDAADVERGLALWSALGIDDYVIFSADKPSR